MDLKSFYSQLTSEAREEFAKKCGTSRGVIQNVMYGVRPCSTDLAVLIEHHSDGVVTVEESARDARWVRVPDPTWPGERGRPLEDHLPVDSGRAAEAERES